MPSRTTTVVFVLLVTVGMSISLGVPTAQAVGTPADPIPIDSCMSDPLDNGTYILTQDIEITDERGGTCLELWENVVLLGNGHTIRGPGNGTGLWIISDTVTVRNVTITGFAEGVFVEWGILTINDSTISNNGNGINVVDDHYGTYAAVRNSTISDNHVGIRGQFVVVDSRIVDNDEGLVTGTGGSITRSVIAGNDEYGVYASTDPRTDDDEVYAQFNYWGAADGPSSEGPNAPLADPVTGALANGSGDQVSGSVDEPGVSTVRFDPYLTTPPNETTVDAFYQVDLAVGDPIRNLSADRLYSDEGRLVSFLHGHGDNVTRTGTPPTFEEEYDECVAVDSWSVENGTATVEFEVADGCSLDLTLASYEKPGPGFSRETADQQRLYDFETERFGAGTHVLEVSLPEASTAGNESAALAAP